MKHILRALAFALGLSPLAAMAQSAPANLPAMSVYGRLGFPGTVGPGQAIPFSTLSAQLGTSGIPSVTIESQKGGCSIPDNTSALIAAVNSVPGPVRVLFPNNCTYNFRQANAINFTKNGVYLEGAGKFSTVLQFQPSTDGAFLQWSNGLNVMTGGGVSKLSLMSSDTTHTKIMVQWYDLEDFDVRDIFCAGGVLGGPSELTGGAGSQCVYSHGRDGARVLSSWLNAQVPIHLGMNPHWYGSVDHYHFSDLTLIGDLGTGSFPLIQVDPGVVFTSTTFDGAQEWNGGTHGINAVDTAPAHLVSSVTSAGSGYVAGTSVTLTGGTCTSPIHITPLTVNGSGGILTASIDPLNTGVCSVTPSNPVSAASGGAAFNLTLVAGYRLKFENVRSEQGVDTVSYTFNLKPAATLQGLVISNSSIDSKRCGVFLKNTFYATIEQSFYGLSGCGVAVNATAANSNDMLNYIDDFWVLGTTQVVTGLTNVRSDGAPPSASATIPPTALYSSTVSGVSFQNLGIIGSYVQSGLNGSITLTAPTAVGAALNDVWPSVAGTIVTSATAPVVENATTGAVSCPTCLASATGLLLAAQEPAHTGDVTNTAGSLAMTLATAQAGAHTWSAPQTHSGQIISTFGAPTIASGACGTGTNGTISGTNQSGTITIGAAATTSCAITFGSGPITAPNACLIFSGNATAAQQGSTGAFAGAPSTTQWTITGLAMASTVYRYLCL